MDSGLALRAPRNDGAPVNSPDKPNNLRKAVGCPYMPSPLARGADSRTIAHALYAAIPRRSARPASGFGSRGQAREVEAGGARMERAVAVSAREDALLHGQRPEGFLLRLLLRQARQHLRLRHGDRGRLVSGSRRAHRRDGGRRAAAGDAPPRPAPAPPQNAPPAHGTPPEILFPHPGPPPRPACP